MVEEKFGPNVWLIDEMYHQFVTDPSTVAESWRDFFADYKPSPMNIKTPDAVESVQPKKKRRKQKS